MGALVLVGCGGSSGGGNSSSGSSSNTYNITGNYVVGNVRCVFGANGMFCANNTNFWYTTSAVVLKATGTSVPYSVTSGASYTLSFGAVSSATPNTISATDSFNNTNYNLVRNSASGQDVDVVGTYSDSNLLTL